MPCVFSAGLPAAPAHAPTHLLYLHGFRSSPQSFKAQRVAAWLAANQPGVRWWCPQLPPSPRAAMALVLDGTAHWPAHTSAVVGSSLGGFYATAVAAARGWPAVLLNPAVDPARDLAAYIGEQTAYHRPEERFFFRPEFVDELRALTVPARTALPPCFALLAQGDELLDWREMAARYPSAQRRVLHGSDHALSDFDHHLPELMRWLGWRA
ncbi:MAG: YqiA/YcfP family alpha/beta fold hydrolase [Rubrivivax sp.]|jgi:predicted esterase YcpF (UPF0227 family)